mmetsp:Transcript_22047/g.51744  ORF Transcript_22047/g.51744 Transcript_22047/m.51744 type:complete len:250 (-) Transcript_22047:172-921(-)|eukprot:s351_g27.t1
MGNSSCFSFLQSPSKITTGYWDFRGLGAPMRMMCTFAKVPWEDVKYSVKQKAQGSWIAPEWELDKRPQLRQQNPLVQLPYVINHSTGEVIAQSSAVYLYLGRILGLGGATHQEQMANEQVLFYLYGMWMEIRDLVYPSYTSRTEESFRSSLDNHFSGVSAHYEKLEAWLRRKDAPFFASSRPCTADFHVWEMLDQQECMARAYGFASPLEDHACLKAFYQRFRELPELEPYFASGDYTLPMNNKMAFYK